MGTFYQEKKIPINVTAATHLMRAAHLHDHVEIVCMLEGRAYAICNGVKEEICAGDVFVAFPNQIHCYELPQDHSKIKHIIMIFSPQVFSEFKQIFRTMMPVKNVVKAASLEADVMELAEKVRSANKSDGVYHTAICRGYLGAFLGTLFAHMDFCDVKESNSDIFQKILSYCNNHYTEPLSLDQLSRDLNIGKYYISHIFGDKLKMSFPDYINRLRIQDAIGKIKEREHVLFTDLAWECGFSSTRSFNRAFWRYTQKTPRQFKKELDEHPKMSL